jgi:hypothetical protein
MTPTLPFPMPTKEWTRSAWIAEFATEVTVNLRPEIGRQHARTIAVNEWPARKDVDPLKAAAQWAAEQEARRNPSGEN